MYTFLAPKTGPARPLPRAGLLGKTTVLGPGNLPDRPVRVSAELCNSLIFSDRRRNTPKSAHNRSESWCAGLWVPCRIFWVWFGLALDPNPARTRRISAGSLQVFGALFAQPRGEGARLPLNGAFYVPTYVPGQGRGQHRSGACHSCSRCCGCR